LSESTGQDRAGSKSALTPFTTTWGLIVPGALLVWFTFPTFVSLIDVWSTYNYSHGYLVLGLTALLVVTETRRARLAAPVPSWGGFVCLLGLVLLTIAARVTATQTLALVAWPLSWIAAIWACAGWGNARRFVLPLGYLLVAIPVWDVLVEPLRRLTVGVVTMWIHAAGLPAFIDGNFIHVPNGTFEVLDGCAGLRYALVALALSTFLGLFNYRRWQPTVMLIVCALALVVVGNWLRVFVTVAVGFSPGGLLTTLVRDHHTLFGWIVFVIFMIPLALIHRRLEGVVPTESSGVSALDRDGSPVQSGGLVTLVSCAGVLALAIWWTLSLNRLDAELPRAVPFENPEIAGWKREGDWRDGLLPQLEGATVQTAAWYADGTVRVGAFVAAFANQGQGGEAVSLSHRPAGPSAVAIARRAMEISAVSGGTVPFAEMEVSDPGDNRRLVWTGLRVAGSSPRSVLSAKLFQLRGVLRGRRDAQVLILTVACAGGCDEARASLSRFASAAAESLYEHAEKAVLTPATASGRLLVER
jgi:EpsI family protein